MNEYISKDRVKDYIHATNSVSRMAERICLMTFYPTKCKDNCFNCDCGGAEATKDMYVSIHNVQRVCAITGGTADTDEGEYIAEVIRNNLENMVIPAADIQPVSQWISCKDRMPDDNELVLFCYVGESGIKSVHYGYHQTVRGLGSSWAKPGGGRQYCDDDVTHWQPVPEPPKGGDTNARPQIKA